MELSQGWPPAGNEDEAGPTERAQGWGDPARWGSTGQAPQWGQPTAWGHPGTGGAVPGPTPSPGPQREPSALRRAWQRVVATLAAVGAFLLKFGALLLKLKYVTLVGSMLVSIAAYTWLWGWTFAVGFVLLILVHEMGHVITLRAQGVRSSLPLFIPFLGAFVNMKEMPRNVYQEAVSGLAGPAFGTAGSIAVAVWAHATGSGFLQQLAFVGFFLNIFNMLPALPLDGGRAVGALHPAIWFVGLVGLLVFEIFYPSPVVPIILLLGGYELWKRWRGRNSRAAQAYYAMLPGQRALIGALYVGILAVALVGLHSTYLPRSL